MSHDTIQEIKTQLIKNKWKLKRQKVEDLKPVINSEIYEALLNEMLSDFTNVHKFFKSLPLELLLAMDRNYEFIETTNSLF